MEVTKSNKEMIISRIKEAFKNSPDGFTLNQNGLNFNVKKGFGYSITNNKNNDIDFLIKSFFELVKKHKAKYYKIGGWFSNKDNMFFLDISFYTLKFSRAVFQAIKYKQQAIFNFSDFKCINTE